MTRTFGNFGDSASSVGAERTRAVSTAVRYSSSTPSQRARPAALVGIASATIFSGAAIRAKPFLVRSSSTRLSQWARPAALVGIASATILSAAAIRAKPGLVRSSSTRLSQPTTLAPTASADSSAPLRPTSTCNPRRRGENRTSWHRHAPPPRWPARRSPFPDSTSPGRDRNR